LRAEISRLEGENQSALALKARRMGWQHAAEDRDRLILSGSDLFDAALGGGLEKAALHEIRSAETRDNGAASAFVLSLGRLALSQVAKDSALKPRLLWISDRMGSRETGLAYAPGFVSHGLPAGSLIHAAPRHLNEALMIAEAALTVSSFAAIIFEIYGNPPGFGLTESRRLHLRAKAYKRPLLLLRERGAEEASSAAVRLRVGPAPSRPRLLPDGRAFAPSIGNPVFRVAIEKSRNPAAPDFLLEWNADDCLFSHHDRVALSAARQPAHPGALFPEPLHRPDRAAALGSVVAFDRAS
jgi:protein ImuA